MDAYEDTNINWRVRRGYGALMAAYGASLPLALNCQVSLIDHSGKALSHRDLAGHARRRQGDHHRADQFDCPGSDPLPSRAARQARCRGGLPLGLADKVMLALDDPKRSAEGTAICGGATMRTKMGTFHLRPFGPALHRGFLRRTLRAGSWKMPATAPSPPTASTRSSRFSAMIIGAN